MKIDLTKLLGVKTAAGEATAMKASGLVWAKPAGEPGILPTVLRLDETPADKVGVSILSSGPNSMSYVGTTNRCHIVWDMTGRYVPPGTRLTFVVNRTSPQGGRFIVRASDAPNILNALTYYDQTTYGSFPVRVDVNISSHPVYKQYFGFLILGQYGIEITEFQLIYP